MTAATLVIAVDCSTTAAKAVVLDAAGAVVARASRPLRTEQPRPAWHEQDAEQWWAATREAVAEAVAALPDPGLVQAMCLTHQRESFVCLGTDGRPLRPAILWLDGRAHDEIAALGTQRVHELSGKPPDTTPAVYKLAWLAKHEPTMLAAAERVGDVQAYLVWKLTGRWATGQGSADTLGLFDLQRGDWSSELLALAGVRADQLPELVATGDEIAALTSGAARSLGLPGPVPLVAGIGDGQAAGLALGATEPGVAYLNLGTSMVLGVQSDAYRWDPAFRTMAGIRPGTYTFETVLNAAAYVASWCREQFGEHGVDGVVGASLEAAAARVPIGAEGLLTLPYWNAAQTPHWDALARGATIGWHGRHTRAHLYRSILEGVGFELRLHLERLEAATGARVDVIRVVGGGARSSLWIQIVTDITGRPVRVCAEQEVSAAGAGVLAREFLASADEPADARRREPAEPFTPAGRDARPDPSTAAGYDALYAVYRQLYPALRGVFGDLAAATAVVASAATTPTTSTSTVAAPLPPSGPGPARFPDLSVRSLAGTELVLPRDLTASRTLVVCAFRQRQQRLVEEWITWAVDAAGIAPSPLGRGAAASSVVLEVPVLGRRFRPARRFIDGGMASSIAVPEVLARTLTAYTDVARFCRAAGIGTTATVTAFVVGRDGAILAQVTGSADDDRRAVVAAALAGAG